MFYWFQLSFWFFDGNTLYIDFDKKIFLRNSYKDLISNLQRFLTSVSHEIFECQGGDYSLKNLSSFPHTITRTNRWVLKVLIQFPMWIPRGPKKKVCVTWKWGNVACPDRVTVVNATRYAAYIILRHFQPYICPFIESVRACPQTNCQV